ncbi:MAG: ABC transporter permease [Terriglobales bacterium]
MPTAFRNLHYAARQLRNSPGFALTAILTLTVGIGGTVAVFSVVNAVLLRPLPFTQPDQLVSLHERSDEDKHELRVTAPDLLIFQHESHAFSGVAGFISSAYELTGAGDPFEAKAERVSASLFDVLGSEPRLGRAFSQPEDDNGAPVAVISDALWRDHFHSDASVLGRTIDLDRRPYTIIGVMPRSFAFPLDGGRLSGRDLWVPLSLSPVEKQSEGNNFDYGVVARLKLGISKTQAQQDVDLVTASIDRQYPFMSRIGLHAYFRTLKDETVQHSRQLLGVLLGAVAVILLIACVNLANLLLVRGAGRKREFGVRLALGADMRATFSQLITESLFLGLLGGIGGTGLAVVLTRLSPTLLPESLPQVGEVSVNWPVLVFAALVTAVTGLVCGLAPAFQSLRINLLDSLREGERGTGERSQHLMRNALVVTEISLAMVLLVGSGLFLRSLSSMLAVDPGFEPAHVLKASLSLPVHEYSTQSKVNDFLNRLQSKLEALPGTKSVGFSSSIPVVGQKSGRLIAPEGYVKKSGEGWLVASNYLVHGNYFEGMHIPLIQGRYFSSRDDQLGAPLAVVISQKLAHEYFPGKDPVGMHIKVGPSFNSPMPAMTIIGVVGDIKQGGLDQPTVPEMYEPLTQAVADLGSYGAMIGVVGGMNVEVRTTGDPSALGSILARTVRQLDPQLAVSEVNTMDEVVSATESSRRFNTLIVTAFGATALLLSLLGIYGTMAYTVAQRNREIAICIAVGASRENILRGTLGKALKITGLGIAGGLALSLAFTRLIADFLFNVKPLDTAAMAGAVSLLLVCSMIAAWLPAKRAASVDPMRLLRFE